MKPDDLFVANLDQIPVVEGLRRDEGWVNMQVQFAISKASAGTDNLLVGWTVMPPGAMHDRHKHTECEEFWIVIEGEGIMFTNDGEQEARQGDFVLIPRGHWHGFKNTSNKDAVLAWGWSGAGALEDSGYEVDHDNRHE